MVKGLARSIGRGAPQSAPIRRADLAVNTTMTVDGATGVGFGTVVVGDFPQGNVLILGAVAYLQFTGPTSASLVDTWEGDYSVGSTPASDATLTDEDVNIVSSTAIAAATAEASPVTRGTSSTADLDHVLDNTDGSLEVNVSLLVDDADISADGLSFTVEGTIHLSYLILGDD